MADMDHPEKCPRCDSPAPHLHPAMQHGGEVQPCPDAWHFRPDLPTFDPKAEDFRRKLSGPDYSTGHDG